MKSINQSNSLCFNRFIQGEFDFVHNLCTISRAVAGILYVIHIPVIHPSDFEGPRVVREDVYFNDRIYAPLRPLNTGLMTTY